MKLHIFVVPIFTFPFSLHKNNFLPCDSYSIPLGVIPLVPGMAWSYATSDCKARTGVTADGLAHCCPTECGMDKFPLLPCGGIWVHIISPVPDFFETYHNLLKAVSLVRYD